MKKLIGLSLLAMGLLLGASRAEAAGPVKGAKGYANVNYTVTVTTVNANGPAVVYAVLLSTGTAGTDYLSLFDSAVTGTVTGTAATFKTRVNVSSATQNTYVVFDPPLQFKSGVVAYVSNAANWAQVTFEPGRILNGY